MRVAFFGTYDAQRHPRVKVLQQGLAAAGDQVVECNVPLGVDTAERVELLRRPGAALGLVRRIGSSWWQLRRLRRALPPVDAVVVGYLGHLDVHLARRLWPRHPIALDFLVSLGDTAVDRRTRSTAVVRLLEAADRAAVRAADLVLVDTEESASLIPTACRSRATVVPVGASSEWFRRPQARHDGPLRVVFFGLYTPLQGASVVGRAIADLAGEPITFTMAGTGQDRARAQAAAARNADVEWIDWVDPDRLPELVASHDLCLGIFGTGRKALRVVPNKVFQGAAAGCSIVTSDTVPQRRALADAATFVEPGRADALATALRDLARDRDRMQKLREAAFARAEEAFRPETVVTPLRARLTAATART